MTQLSASTFKGLVNVTIVTVMAHFSFLYPSVRQLRAHGRISSSVVDPVCPLLGTVAVQQLETGIATSDEWCSYPALRKNGS